MLPGRSDCSANTGETDMGFRVRNPWVLGPASLFTSRCPTVVLSRTGLLGRFGEMLCINLGHKSMNKLRYLYYFVRIEGTLKNFYGRNSLLINDISLPQVKMSE